MTIKRAQIERGLVPPGPSEEYDFGEEFLPWLKHNFDRYGGIYKASVYGGTVYVIGAPEYCEYILRRNWQNYLRKGLVVRRIALALGNNLITSNGEAWVNQRRMVHPAFTKTAIGGLSNMIAAINAELLLEWKEAAKQGKTVNVTHDVSLMVLKITLLSIFGDDYKTAAPQFKFFAEEAARDLHFAQTLDPLRKLVLWIVAQRRRENRISADSLGVMMQARDRDSGQPMPDAQLAREVLNLVVAGHETTASLLNWMWYLLATHPEAQNRLATEFNQLPWEGNCTIEEFPKYAYTRQVIDEALRLYPPLWLMTRQGSQERQAWRVFCSRANRNIHLTVPHSTQPTSLGSAGQL